MRAVAVVLVWQALAGVASAQIAGEARRAIARHDLAGAEQQVREWRAVYGATPEWLEALSWLARGALEAHALDRADALAEEARKLATEALRGRALDAERHLPLALGAAIEVHAQVLDAHGQRARAVAFLSEQLETYLNTSIATRIQKNLNLLSLVGRPAPPLAIADWIGTRPPPLESLKGHPVLLFFWAHWCPDCKREAPDLAKLLERYGPKGLVLIAPTQFYGYVAMGQEAAPAEEKRYIAQVRNQYYAALGNVSVPVDQRNFRAYGASTTPTLVLIDHTGIVRFFHPGAAPYQELTSRIDAILSAQ